ncbi:hypothetical protein IWX47DRAFT_870832 [Phyllosticta citricarpa]
MDRRKGLMLFISATLKLRPPAGEPASYLLQQHHSSQRASPLPLSPPFTSIPSFFVSSSGSTLRYNVAVLRHPHHSRLARAQTMESDAQISRGAAQVATQQHHPPLQLNLTISASPTLLSSLPCVAQLSHHSPTSPYCSSLLPCFFHSLCSLSLIERLICDRLATSSAPSRRCGRSLKMSWARKTRGKVRDRIRVKRMGKVKDRDRGRGRSGRGVVREREREGERVKGRVGQGEGEGEVKWSEEGGVEEGSTAHRCKGRQRQGHREARRNRTRSRR